MSLANVLGYGARDRNDTAGARKGFELYATDDCFRPSDLTATGPIAQQKHQGIR